jgi:hypothetical protein
MPFDGQISLAGVPFNGKIDLLRPTAETDGVMTWLPVRDHKFIRNLDRGLTADEIERDVQMLGYGMVAAALVPSLTHVDLGHLQYQKEEPRPSAQLVNRIVPLPVIQKRWQSYEKIVERMKAVTGVSRPEDVPGNYEACMAFGKKYACPHLEECRRFKGGSKVSGFSAEEMALFGIAPQAQPQQAVTDGPGWAFVECEVCGMPMTALGKRPPGHKIAPEQCPNVGSHEAALAHTPAPAVTPVPTGIIPPDAPVSAPQLAAACPSCETEKNFQHRPEDCPKVKPTRGRPRKAAALVDAAPPATALPPLDTSPTVAVPAVAAPAAAPAQTLSASPEYIVYSAAAIQGLLAHAGMPPPEALPALIKFARTVADEMVKR